jgi:hypothetical protein
MIPALCGDLKWLMANTTIILANAPKGPLINDLKWVQFDRYSIIGRTKKMDLVMGVELTTLAIVR